MYIKMTYYRALFVWLLVSLPWVKTGLCESEATMAAAALFLAGVRTGLSAGAETKEDNSGVLGKTAKTNNEPAQNALKESTDNISIPGSNVVNAPVTNNISGPGSNVASAPVANTVAVAVPNEVSAPELTNKYDKIDKHIEELIQQSEKTKGRSREPVASSPLYIQGKLQELEKKAFEYNALKSESNDKDAMISDLINALKEARSFINKQRVEMDRLNENINSLSGEVTQLKKEQEKLKESLKIFQMGKYEYYEIKGGDTCESIAADPAIYGNEKEAHHIRQANWANVDDLDNLTPGQILIIPRYPDSASGQHAF